MRLPAKLIFVFMLYGICCSLPVLSVRVLLFECRASPPVPCLRRARWTDGSIEFCLF